MINLLLLVAALPALSLQQCLSENDNQMIFDPNSRLSLYKGQQVFSLNLLKELNKRTPHENVFFSPFSVYTALMLSYFISANNTEASIKNVLHLPQQQTKVNTMHAYRLEKQFQELRMSNKNVSYELITANRLFVSNKEVVRDCMEDLFRNEITKMDFTVNPQASVKLINDWIAGITKNQIKNLLSDGSLTTATKLVLTNAAYFKGVWKSKFPPENTKNDKFYSSNSEHQDTRMMRQKSTFNHLASEKLGAQILELPYKGEDIALFIILPAYDSPNGITHLLDRLTIEAFQEMVTPEGLIPRPVEVIMPKFSIEHEIDDLNKVLERMGVGNLFQRGADLSTLTGRPGIGLDEAVHKAKIKLDEEGTTAAAATAFFHFRSSRPLEPAKFEANHPFLYFIYDKVSQTILFSGIFNKATEKPI